MSEEKCAIEYRSPRTNRMVTVVHFCNPDCSDMSLCGCDLVGDHAYECGARTKEPVNCRQCVELILFCKAIREKEYITNDKLQRDTHLLG